MNADLDYILRLYSPEIYDFGYITKNLQTGMDLNIGEGKLLAYNRAKTIELLIQPFGITPSQYFDDTMQVSFFDEDGINLGV